MTPEQRLDRLERIVRLLCEATCDTRDARKRVANFKAYFAAYDEHEAAKDAAARQPEDSAASETLRRAKENLNRAREELQRSIGNKRKRFSKSDPD